jgi:hypothetical protein
MMNPRKPVSPFANMGQPQGGQSGGQYGANANPSGNGWGQQFMQQFGAPPGQMRDEWNTFRADNGIGGGGFGMGGMGGQQTASPTRFNSPVLRNFNAFRQNFPAFRSQLQGWVAQRPTNGADRAAQGSWLSQFPRGLLGG